MGLGTATIGAGLRALLARRIKHLSDLGRWRRDTTRLQIGQLRALLRHGAGAAFGREHDFARLAELPDNELPGAYRKAVPAGDYEAFRSLISSMRDEGRPDVLWPGLITRYAQTSGTTAGDKYIPVSEEMMRSNRRAALDIFAHAARFGVSLPRILAGKVLFLGGSTDLSVNQHGIATGDLSGLVTPMIRWPISEIYLPGRRIALMSDWPAKIDAMAEACLDEDVRMVNGMPSWMLVLFERVIALARARAGGREIRTIRDVWPNFTFLVHGGVKYAPFDPRMRQCYSGDPLGPDIPVRLELYPASEGFIALQDAAGDPGLRLLSDIGNYYEFIPLERIHDADPPAYGVDAVEKGVRYVVCMTTCAGLWRYILGDVVEFDTVPAGLDATARGGEGPARLRIVGRHKHFINAFGENLIVEHIENAVAAAARAAGIVVGEFTAAPVYPAPGVRAGLELAVEVEDLSLAGRSEAALRAFGQAFDDSLKAQNADYTTKRTGGLGMAPPIITPLELGAFHRWMRSRGKLGGQHKCPRCANHRELLDSLLACSGATAEAR